MTLSDIYKLGTIWLTGVALLGCGGASRETVRTAPEPVPAERQRYTAADVHFMSVMIGHHAQAIVMARWAASHDASPSIRTLAERIINAQEDEIAIMQQWLRDRGQPVPSPDAHHHAAIGHGPPMPGMLTEEQMKQLDGARGKDFDRLFLTFMIQHHRGAVTMVKDLIGAAGAAQDDTVFKLAADINVDQTTEINRMQRMLADMLFEPGT